MNTEQKSEGVGISTVLVIIFFVLKVTHLIAWSWWWVFAPWWIPAALVLAILGVTAVVGVLIAILS